ncbi:MAG: hypothetical protein LH630_05000 [Actinomycetia bacterium]|nr:hypothetical protein [Actinomycetes bacterium]
MTTTTGTVAQRCEAECRQRMAERANTDLTWQTRSERDDMAAAVCVLLDQFNLLTLGR